VRSKLRSHASQVGRAVQELSISKSVIPGTILPQLAQRLGHLRGFDVELAQDARHDAVALFDERDEQVLGLDLGDARIGVAISDPDRRLAVPVGTIHVGQPPGELKAVAALVAEHDATLLVIGLPRSMSGEEGPRAALAREFGAALDAVLHVPVPYAMIGVGALAIWWHRPRKAAPPAAKDGPGKESVP